MAPRLPQKISLAPKKHHGFQFFIFLCGCLLPPIAVAVRFGAGHDLLINVILCICGYFPCHFHNFYIQNIRDNTHRARTPKWVLKAGLVDTTDIERKKRKSQWSKRYNERNNESTHVGAMLEEGEEGDNYVPEDPREAERQARLRNEGLWNDTDDAEYYNPDQAPNQRHWHYPANFEGAAVGDGRTSKVSGASTRADRWERSDRARGNSVSSGSSYPAAVDQDVPEWGKDYGSRRSTKNKKATFASGNGDSRGKGGWASNGGFADDVARQDGWTNGSAGAAKAQNGNGNANGNAKRGGDIFDHEF